MSINQALITSGLDEDMETKASELLSQQTRTTGWPNAGTKKHAAAASGISLIKGLIQPDQPIGCHSDPAAAPLHLHEDQPGQAGQTATKPVTAQQLHDRNDAGSDPSPLSRSVSGGVRRGSDSSTEQPNGAG